MNKEYRKKERNNQGSVATPNVLLRLLENELDATRLLDFSNFIRN